jgi:hypothetical protein
LKANIYISKKRREGGQQRREARQQRRIISAPAGRSIDAEFILRQPKII